MKLSLKKITTDRSLQRRWALSDAEPVISYLPPDTDFSPADLRIWWNDGAGEPAKDHTLHIYAWPFERDNHISVHWFNGYNHLPIPQWIQELSDVVHEDLIANATSANTGAEDLWGYGVDRDWTIEDAPPLPSQRYPHEPFAPASTQCQFASKYGLVKVHGLARIVLETQAGIESGGHLQRVLSCLSIPGLPMDPVGARAWNTSYVARVLRDCIGAGMAFGLSSRAQRELWIPVVQVPASRPVRP